ncbi:MAG: tetraacyldisaccharide 4'-kinase [bacterium]|nr:tetraacyldisaccharide 4'-kinase [bacterium]
MKQLGQRLERAWLASPAWWLRGLASLYALGWRTYAGVYRWGLRRRVALPIPVIGVGSLWAGGVGKTPVTIAIARQLAEWGAQVTVLTHGYGGSRYRQTTLIEPREYPDPAQVGDEAAELRLALPDVPIAVGKRRVPTAIAAIERWSPEMLVVDDGFQHLPLARTLDLVLLPAETPLGNGYCLPAGPLREPPSGLTRASGIVLVSYPSRPPLPQPPMLERVGIPIYTASVAPVALLELATGNRLPLGALMGRPLTLLCGVARPERFLETTQSLGYTVESVHAFADHHAYTPDELRFTASKTILTTAKDAVKLRTRLPHAVDAYALLVEAHLDNALQQRLHQILTGTTPERRKL